MQGELENALQACNSDSKEQQVFVNLMEEIQRLKTITRGLLLLSQADAGRLPINRQATHLSALLQELAEDVEALANNSEIQLKLDIAPNIHVQADWPMLRQSILNLLTNAIHYNEPKGFVNVGLSSDGKMVTLEVCNSGPGIPHEDQSRIFSRFFRVDAARSKRIDGVGLGLSLAREIVRAHGGTLVLKESRPGRTSFTMCLATSPH
jgi:signal transduction histidine kinase